MPAGLNFSCDLLGHKGGLLAACLGGVCKPQICSFELLFIIRVKSFLFYRMSGFVKFIHTIDLAERREIW